MSIYRPIVQPEHRQALRRQKLALTARLRENWRLKAISLLAAVCLYVYIQNDRNPTVSNTFPVEVKFKEIPDHTEIKSEQTALTLAISGPRAIVDLVKPGEILINVSLADRPHNRDLTIPHPDVSIPALSASQFNQLTIEQKSALHVRIMDIITRQLDVSLNPKPTRPGFHYGTAIVSPHTVTVSGWQEGVKRVKRVVVEEVDQSASSQPDKIDDDFMLSARDADNHEVPNVSLKPNMVHVSIPVNQNPPEFLGTVSPNISTLPNPLYVCAYIGVDPKRVKLTGTSGKSKTLYTVSTEPISLKGETHNRDFEVDLAIPSGFTVSDEQGHPLDRVTVHVVIQKSISPAPQKSGTDVPPLPPVDPNG